MASKIRITYEASPWHNGRLVSRRRWLLGTKASEMVAATVRMVPETRIFLWAVYMPSMFSTAYAQGEIRYGDNRTLARINAKKSADAALRKMARGGGA